MIVSKFRQHREGYQNCIQETPFSDFLWFLKMVRKKECYFASNLLLSSLLSFCLPSVVSVDLKSWESSLNLPVSYLS